jgi:hypothetical protein
MENSKQLEDRIQQINGQSIGEFRVRTKFNPSASGLVNQIKEAAAHLINLVSTIDVGEVNSDLKGELIRLKSMAMTNAEQAASDGVKAATFSSYIAGK